MITENDAIGKYYPKAKDAMAKEPYWATYFTYEQFKAFVAKYRGPDHYGYHGHQTQIYEPVNGAYVGTIGLLYHNSPIEQEYVVSFTPTNIRAQPVWGGGRPVQTYFIKDLDQAYATMIAVAYPNMQLWQSYLTGFDQGVATTPEAAIKKYQDMVPTWCNFSEEQMTQFVKNLEVQ